MDITVAICTRNRAASLQTTLQSFTEIESSGGDWELLVVDNGSTDNTGEVIASFAGRLPIRSEREAKPGLSNARNRAVAAAHGEFMAWTDDDVLVDRNWLTAYAEAFARWPEASLFGGRVIPVLEQPCEPWFRDNLALLEGVVAMRDFGDDPIPLSSEGGRLPYGANYAIRTSEQRRFAYDPELGVAPGRRRTGEEVMVFTAMLQEGLSGRWVPQSRVLHLIGRERQTIGYIRSYFAAQGETAAHMERPSSQASMMFGMPRWLIRRMFSRYLGYRIARLTAKPEVWLEKLVELGYDEGMVAYWRQIPPL